ncbi:MAG: hypothetical protein Unbinned2404contig1000_43 [Prokaryotic dsDNA virus sp.]|nr:MAG: hypothetical protein Unbinned2404contig1000_43 [Prokaryotic dsDNA virus sp.]
MTDEATTRELIRLAKRVKSLERDIDDMMGRFSMVGKLWDAVKELQDHANRNGDFLVHTLLYREVK